jgi:hypothetical protein
VQLPAGKTESVTRTYYVAVSSSRSIPSSLNQQFLASPPDQLVRVEPVDSIGRIVQDTLDQSGGTTDRLAENQYTTSTGATKSTIFDLTDKQTLSANVVPFNLNDVSLFVSQRTTANRTILQVADPSTGVIDLSNVGTIDSGLLETDDITMREDGTLWGYQSDFTQTGTRSHAGNILQIDPSTAVPTTYGPDNIPDPPAPPPPNPITIQYVNSLLSGSVGAIAWGGTADNPLNNSLQEPLYLAVDDLATGVSALYSADWTNGNAFVTQGRIQPGRVFGGNLLNPLDLTNSTKPKTSTDFSIPGLLVTFTDQTFGSGGNGRNINFTEDGNMQPGAPPIVVADPTVPTDVDVTFNPNGVLGTIAKTFGNNNNGEIDFTAQKLGIGTAANPISVQFQQVASLTGNAKTSVSVTGNNIKVLLNQGNHPTVQNVIDAINNTPAAFALVNAATVGQPGLDVITPQGGGIAIDAAQPNPMVLSNGQAPTTVQDLANAINGNPALSLSMAFQPSTSGTTIIGDEISQLNQPTPPGPRPPYTPGPPITQLTLSGGTGATGFTTGLAFGPDTNTLYGVSDSGQFFRVDVSPTRTTASATRARDLAGNPALIFQPTQVTVPGINGAPQFAGLTRGPLNLDNGAFANDFFAVTSDGNLVCLDNTGAALPVFDSNGDGQADAYTVQLRTYNKGAAQFPNGLFTGLCFSPLDFNLWHPTNSEPPGGASSQHNIATQNTGDVPDQNVDRFNSNTNTSFYFGFENTGNNAALGPYGGVGTATGTAATFTGAVSDFTETGTLANNTTNPVTVADATPITPPINAANQFAIDPADPSFGNLANAFPLVGRSITITGQQVNGTFQISNFVTDPTSGLDVITVTPNFPAGNPQPTPQQFDSFTVDLASFTQFFVGTLADSNPNHLIGKNLVFTSGPQANITATTPNPATGNAGIQIANFDPVNNIITLNQALPAVPQDGNGFRIQTVNPASTSRFDASSVGSPPLSNVDDFYDGDTMVFDANTLTPQLRGKSFTIQTYLGPSHTFIFQFPLPAKPQDQTANGGTADTFTIQHTTPSAPPEQLPDGGQLGILSRRTQYTGSGTVGLPLLPADRTAQELLDNPLLPNSYNFPGGAYGTLETGQFSLKGIQAGDLPTFYFDYFLDNDDGSSNLNGRNMTDSARVFVGPFTRLDTNTPVTVPSAFVTGSPTPGATQFNAFSSGLSAVSGIYNGKILQFNSGVLAGQAKIITNYIVNGTSRTFVFANGFSAAPANGDSFSIGNSVTTWDLLSTNNSVLDNSGTSTIDGELPTFLSQQDSAMPQNPRQQVQQLFNNTGTWRQARVDLSRYAGLDNLQFRIDFSSGGTVDRDWTPTSQNTAVATPFEDSYYTGNFGSLSKNSRLQNNNHVGMYLDNLVVGLAGRGEMVTKSQIDPNVVAPSPRTTPVNWKPGFPAPTAVPSGPYQLEIRRGDDYGQSLNNINDQITLMATYDLHQQILPDERLTTPPSPIIKDSFETGSLTTNTSIIWSSAGVQPWTVNTTTANTGSFAAASGPIEDSQTSALQASLATGQGTLTFAYNTQADTGDFLRFYIDGVLVTDVNGALTEWDGNSNGFVKETVPVSAGWHIFRWAYEKDNQAGNPGQVFIDDVTFPTPSVGVQDLYADQSLYFKFDAQNNPDDPVQNVLHFGDASLPTGMLRIGDQNLHRTQGNVQITQNSIDSSAQAGILVDTGPRDANSNNPYDTVRNLPTLSTDGLVPGVVLANNIVSNSGSVGISLSGDANAAVGGRPVPVSAVPFYRVINNTVFGGSTATGIGIQVGVNAGPSLLNNIIANTATGIAVNPTSVNTTVIGANLFSSNNNNISGATATNSIIVPSGTQIFRNAAARNFYPVAGSPAVDSSLNTLADRPSIAAVESAVGIPQSPILAPESDLYGQLRLDDPSVSPPPGLGQNIFKDRGAVERADFSRPTAAVFVTDTADADIVDNDSLHRDRNGNPFDMAIRNTDLTRFVIQLADVGVQIDDATAKLTSQYTLTEDGVTLVDGVDYTFAYDESADRAIFVPTSGIWPQNHTYTITINNSATGVLDAAGNPILPNRETGETSFNIFVGFLFDFGDAPDPTYPTLLASGGARSVVHLDSSGNPDFYLGATVTEESDAFQSALADGDKNPDGTSSDDGIQFPNGLAIGLNNTIIVTAHIPTGMTGFLDAWFDLNADGAWTPNEELISHHSLSDGTNSFTVQIPAGTKKEITFARFRLSSAGTSSPVGEAPDGEVEDYQLTLGGPPYQNFNNNLDVNNDGFIAPSDALTVINLLNAYGSLALPTNLFTPQGGGPGKAFYVDVTGDNFMAPNDALAVISYINSHKIIGGEGEGAASTLAASNAPAATSDAASTAIIPPVLYASSSVVVETRDPARPAVLANSTAGSAASQDAALLVLSDDASSGTNSKSDSRPKTQTEPLGDTAWDELLTSLASDQHDNDKTA